MAVIDALLCSEYLIPAFINHIQLTFLQRHHASTFYMLAGNILMRLGIVLLQFVDLRTIKMTHMITVAWPALQSLFMLSTAVSNFR